MHEQSHRGQNDEWITPPYLIDQLGPFDLDPCADVHQPWPCATTQWIFEDMGLMRQWFGRVWLNPPYGPESPHWLAKLAAHNNGIALIYARVETRWWRHTIWKKAAAVLLCYRRIQFYRPNGTLHPNRSTAPNALIAYGENNAIKLRQSGIKGVFLDKWNMI